MKNQSDNQVDDRSSGGRSFSHTPGPWQIHNNVGRKGGLGIVADGAPCVIACMSNVKAWPVEAEANARLIAAAPDLLEACRMAYRFYRQFNRLSNNEDEIFQAVKQAIRKATGDQEGE